MSVVVPIKSYFNNEENVYDQNPLPYVYINIIKYRVDETNISSEATKNTLVQYNIFWIG